MASRPSWRRERGWRQWGSETGPQPPPPQGASASGATRRALMPSSPWGYAPPPQHHHQPPLPVAPAFTCAAPVAPDPYHQPPQFLLMAPVPPSYQHHPHASYYPVEQQHQQRGQGARPASSRPSHYAQPRQQQRRGQQWGGGKKGCRDEWPMERTPAFFPEAKEADGGAADGQGTKSTPRQHKPLLAPFALPNTARLPADPAAAAALRESVARVLESQLHLVAPFLAPVDLLQLSGVARGWTRAYRGAVAELRVGEPPPGRRSGHWTGLLTLLATLKGLESLHITHAHSVFPLTKCLSFRLTEKLSSLDLSYLRISRFDEQRLLTALGEGCAPALTSLTLANAGLTDRGAELLAAALRAGGLRRLRELDVSLNRIRRGVKELGQALVATGCVPEMEVVVLAGNPLGWEGAALLVEGLATAAVGTNDNSNADSQTQPPLLRTLNLVETGLEVEGCAVLCQGLLLLSHPQTGPLRGLRSLLLNANTLGDAGVGALAAAVGDGALPMLRDVSLGSNYITDEGVARLVAAGSLLARLRRLNLAFNFVTGEGARALVGAWHDAAEDGDEEDEEGVHGRRGRRRRHLDLYQNEIKGAERVELQQEVREHYPGLECVL